MFSNRVSFVRKIGFVGCVLALVLMAGATVQAQQISSPAPTGAVPLSPALASSQARTPAVTSKPITETLALPKQLAGQPDSGNSPQVYLDHWFYVGDGLGGNPDIAYAPSDSEYLIAWSAPEVDGSGANTAVYVRRFDRYGTALANAQLIGYRQQSLPQVVYNNLDGQYLIGWGPYSKIYVQRLDWSGTPLGSPLQIYDNVGMTSGLQEIVINGNETEYFVLFLDKDFLVHGQRIDHHGNLAGPLLTYRDSACNADVVYNWLSHQYLLVGTVPTLDNWEIWGKLLNSDGSVSSSFMIESYAGNQGCPKVAYNSLDNEYLVLWEDDYNGSKDVLGRRVSASGTLLGGYIGVEARSTVESHLGDVAFNDNDGSYLVSWWQSTSSVGYTHLQSYLTTVERNGAVNFPHQSIEPAFAGDRIALTSGAGNDYVVVEQDDNNEVWGRFAQAWKKVYLPLIQRR